ncbi:putative B3 domain-containing protein Os03g0621600 isoform X2 [Lolium perenne]|uniref:putative B3 domain-containing protein Os03g0621600 isoform X2 n=1 Tax=Lolium perenne TaxID=4522 RepID=UPI0021F5AD7A|nr:putative B3 domain-containing protein Os03g0621600 isoform X1 [Lolium perenne]
MLENRPPAGWSVPGRGVLKRMRTSCKACKLRDGDTYRKLDDKKKHFLVFMMGDFRDAMIIPEELLRRFKGEIPAEIKLETRKGDSHSIVVARNQQKHVFTVGWRQFVESYDLQMGDSVILKYNGNSQFNVIIFDKLGQEKALSVLLDPFITQVQDRRSDAHEIGFCMAVPSERCKGYLEYHYMNLDDEKKYLSMLMMGDFQHKMIIPEEFVKRFKGEIPGEITLETKNNCSYIIGVAKHQEKLVLTAGWNKFSQTFGLLMYDTIVFRYKGNSKFSVIIFDKFGCENALTVVVDPFLSPLQESHTNATETLNPSNIQPQSAQMQSPVESMNTSHVLLQPMEMQPSTSTVNGLPMESPQLEIMQPRQMDKSCQGNMAPINISSESSEEFFSSEDEYGVHDVHGSNYIVKKKSKLSSFQKEQLKGGYITTHKTKLTLVQKEAVKQKVESIHSEIPIVVAVMRKSSIESSFFLTFPSHYAKEYLAGGLHVYLQYHDVTWDCRFGDTRGDKKLSIGWKKFAQDNDLKMGDICLFELLSNQKRTMEVYIIRLNDDN